MATAATKAKGRDTPAVRARKKLPPPIMASAQMLKKAAPAGRLSNSGRAANRISRTGLRRAYWYSPRRLPPIQLFRVRKGICPLFQRVSPIA